MEGVETRVGWSVKVWQRRAGWIIKFWQIRAGWIVKVWQRRDAGTEGEVSKMDGLP